MANFGLPDLDFVLYRGYDVTGLVTRFSDEIVNQIDDRTAAGYETAVETFSGPQAATVEMSGFYDSVLTTAMEASPSVGEHSGGVQAVLMYALEGNTLGNKCGCLAHALKKSYKRSEDKGKLHKAALSWAANSALFTIDQATIIAPLAVRTTAGSTEATYVDGGAASNNGGRFYVSVPALALGGYTNLTAQLRHSTDHITWTDVAGALATFTATNAQMIAYSGTTNRYRAIAWAYGGAGAGPSNTLAAALLTLSA